jgi:hypothetical protein
VFESRLEPSRLSRQVDGFIDSSRKPFDSTKSIDTIESIGRICKPKVKARSRCVVQIHRDSPIAKGG